MAIEIPSLTADRLPHPEWGTAPSAGRFLLPAGRLLAALDSTGAPAVVLAGLRAVAAAGGSVQLLLAPDRGLVQILLDGRRIPLTGAARDAVLILLGETAGSGAPEVFAAHAAGTVDPILAARVAAVDAQVREARAHAGAVSAGEVQAAEPASAQRIAAPLMNGPDAAQASRALAQAVDSSGLFLEAHVAQWLRRERSLGQLQDEVRGLPPVLGGASAAASESRANAQLDAQHNQAVRLQALAWPGQPMDLVITRDPERQTGAPGAQEDGGLFQATLSLHLPRLGMLRARIRLLHDTVGLQLAAEQTALLAPALQELATALLGRGLALAAIELAPADAAPRVLQALP